jgi:hypothetical protein
MDTDIKVGDIIVIRINKICEKLQKDAKYGDYYERLIKMSEKNDKYKVLQKLGDDFLVLEGYDIMIHRGFVMNLTEARNYKLKEIMQ